MNFYSKNIKLFVNDRNYSSWIFLDAETNTHLNISTFPELEKINPLEQKMFGRDIFTVDKNTCKPTIIYSYVKTCKKLAGVLVLENNKTYGRTKNKKRLLYKCIPDDIYTPTFLVPYDIKIGFSKKQQNKYVVFQFDNWDNKHPIGSIVEIIGDVDNLDAFYEYQLYCKSLHISMTDFTNKTRAMLTHKTSEEYVEQILNNTNFNIEDRREKYVFTIDSSNCVDFDDGFGIERFGDHWKISIYIANVYVWLETLGLWDSFSQRVATIYLPDRRRPMLPTILSDTLCSLQEKQPRFAVAMDIIVDLNGKLIDDNAITYKNVLIYVNKNYQYEESTLIKKDKCYAQLYDITNKIDNSVLNSYDLVTHWMVQMNSYTGIILADNETGIFRSTTFQNTNLRTDVDQTLSEDTIRTIRTWNNTVGQYVLFDKDADLYHELMSIRCFKTDAVIKKKYPGVDLKITKSYAHVTSPIRRLVDLLNHMFLFQHFELVKNISPDAILFLNKWTKELEYINTSMRCIRKIQTDCETMNRCINQPDIMDIEHDGIVFDKIFKNDGMISYMVYLEKLKLLSRIATNVDVQNYSKKKFKMYLFEDEYKIQKKIRLQII
jgi:exoribonuclease R